MKKRRVILKSILAVLGVFILVVLGYVIYVFASYHRIEDHLAVEPENNVDAVAQTQTPYKITTFNIGFGAYSTDYSFFMDGGSESRAFSKDAVIENTDGAAGWIKELDPDFAFFQEVDLDATRSYHVNQYEMLKEWFPDMAVDFALNFDSAYLFYPILEPHGKSVAGLATFSRYRIESAMRRSLPIDTSPMKFVDLDRCYVVSRIPVENGRELCLYNIHLSAYTKDGTIREDQIRMLSGDMQQEYEKGNYVVCAGDFNQDLYGNSAEIFQSKQETPGWAEAFPKEMLGEGLRLELPEITEDLVPTCRNADRPYVKGENFVTVLDGFILSDNVTCTAVENIDAGFRYSDHNPVLLTFQLEEK